MENLIVFYDIPSIHPLKYWSPHTTKSRYLLNYLKIEYRTEWVTFEEMLPKFSALNVIPNEFYPPYLLPMVRLPGELFVSTSEDIFEHMLRDHRYRIYPDKEYQRFSEKFIEWFEFEGTNQIKNFYDYVVLPFTELVLITRGSRKYFQETKGLTLIGKELEECREDEFFIQMYQEQMYMFFESLRDQFPGYRGFSKDRFMVGLYLYGDKLTYADIVLAATLTWPVHLSEVGHPILNLEKMPLWLKTWFQRVRDDVASK